MNTLTFEQLPTSMQKLLTEVGEVKILLHRLLGENGGSNKQSDWLDLNELVQYDPEKRSKATFYGYVHRAEIPHYKRGKKLYFKKAEIDQWLEAGKQMTNAEIEAEVDTYIIMKGGDHG